MTARQIAQALEFLLPPLRRAAIMGVGARLRRDDYAGMAVAERLAPLGAEGLIVVGGGSAPENCVGQLRAFRPEAVIVIDAARMGLLPGDCALLSPGSITGATFCTHMLPLPVTLSYLEASCGCVTAYVGIEPESTEQGIGMSRAVARGVESLVTALRETLEGAKR